MSEYLLVEKPFLDQLKNLGWTIINHGEKCIPQNPKVSLRENFREIVIKKEFKKWVKKINKTDDGTEWLMDKQLDELYNMLTKVNYPSLLETNKAIMELLIETKPRVDKNEVTGQENPSIKLIDFETPKNNHFLAINQFRINTVGTAKKFIIPDIVLFINGIPIVVIECKIPSSFASNAMEEGIRQLLRYQNRRLNTAGKREKEGEEALFYYNQFMISTYGDEARVGTISSDYEHYLEWKSIYPKEYEDFDYPLLKKRSQEILIQGMLNKENLLKIVKHFIVFKPLEWKKEIKIVCRYQQFRAVQKIVDKLLKGDNHLEKSGVIWHTQGSGKSLTMVFLIRQIRFMDKLKDYKIIMVNDRTDLEEQLGETAKLTGETVNYVEKAKEMNSKLSGSSSDLTLVMMHKFGDKIKEKKLTKNLKDAGIIQEDMLPEIEELGVVNTSDRILILIDEAHRTQNNPFGLSGNLFKAFPNSTKIAFTGTPLISGKHDKKTIEIFGDNKDYIDKYRAKDSVKDGATLQILYVGRKDRIKIKEEEKFEFEFNQLFKNKSPKEIEEINKRYGAYKDFLESDDHIKTVSKDIVDHYSSEILMNGFKAQVVCISKLATVKYKRFIDEDIKEKIKKLENNSKKDDDLIKRLKFLKTAIAISNDGNDPADMIRLSKESINLNAIKNFKKEYNYKKSETGIGILIVCSRLLTGFDAPIEQVMYLDKIMKEHTLFQAITRVNRTHKKKYKGYIVDYIGISNNLIDTLKIYSGDEEDEEGISTIADVNTEKPILRDRYNRLINLFLNKGVEKIEDYILYKIKNPEKQYEVLEKCIEVCENVQTRAQFEVYYKRYLASLDILINLNIDEKYKAAMKAFGHIQARIKNRYKDDSINLVGVGEKVKDLINKHVESKGISNRIPPLELFDVGFKENLYKHKNVKAKASEMEHAMRKEITIKRHTDPALYDSFLEKLKEILKKHSEDAEARFEDMEKLYEEMKKGRKGMAYNNDLDPEKEAPFYDLLINIIFKNINIVDNEDQLKSMIRDMVEFISEEIARTNFWGSPSEIETLKSSIGEKILFLNIEIMEDKEELIASEFVKLAKSNHNVLVS